MSRVTCGLVLLVAWPVVATAQQPPPDQPTTSPTRPPADNDRTLRPLGPNEIPPNLSFYAIDPLYRPDAPLGWADERVEERLDRGLVAMPLAGDRLYFGWRLLRDDPGEVAFNVYRSTAGGPAMKLNERPIDQTTDLVAEDGGLDQDAHWWVVPVVDGREQQPSERLLVPAQAQVQTHRSIRLREDVRSVDRVAIGDLNGDGTYDFVVKHPAGRIDPGRPGPSPDTYKIDGYDGRTGKSLWRIDLGWNIQLGIWFSPMVVRDLDGDGKAEVALRTAPFAATREEAFPDNGKGLILEGLEYLAVYDGETGQEIDRVEWIERAR
jgi:rhamnogalacturonan endolyase